MKWEYLWFATNSGHLMGSPKNLDEIKYEIEKAWKDTSVKRDVPYLLETTLGDFVLFDILGSKEWELVSTYVESNVKVRHMFKRTVNENK